MTQRIAGHALVEALVAQGVDTVFGVPGESYLAVLDGFHEHARTHPLHRLPAGGRRGLHGRGAGQAHRPARRLLRHARPRRQQRRDRRAHRVPGLDADGAVHRPGRQRPARPRGLPGSRLPADVRPRHAGHGQVGRRRSTTPTACPNTWRAPSTSRCRAGPGPVVLALPEDMLTHADRGAGAAARRAGAAPGRRRARCATCAQLLLAARAAARDRRRQRLGRAKRARRCSASPRTGSCRWAARFRFQDTFDNRHPLLRRRRRHRHQPEAGRARARRRPDHRASARAWAR